ncbi:YbgF trimerization domain-containing protein, partial [Streptococcus pyogenes]
PLRRSLLDLNGQIETLRAEIARLRGTNEQLARDLSDTQRKLVDQTQAVEARLKPLEPQKVSLDGREFQVAPDERSQYEVAIGLVR